MTFGGVAAFSRSPPGRLLFMQFIVALLVAASVLCLLISAWFPVIQKTLARLPEKGAIRGGRLEWNNPSPVRLAEGTFLSITVDVEGGSRFGQSADVQFELERRGFKICSLFGCVAVPYPENWTIALNRSGAEPWWGAWRPFLLVGLGVGVVIGVMGSWMVLATLYSLPLRLITFYTDRHVNWSGCWRVAAAAQAPGALLMSGAILLYSFNRLNLVGLLFAWLLHIVVGWIYVGTAPSRLPRLATGPHQRGNPFGSRNKEKKAKP